MRGVSIALATLAFARHMQEGRLNVRQREQLRRALIAAAEFLHWEHGTTRNSDAVERASADVAKLTKNGARSLLRDLDQELVDKKAEVKQLKAASKALHKFAKDKKTEFPVEFSYHYTARDAVDGLVTKTEELELNDADEATSAGNTVDKRLESWGKLKDLMVEALKKKRVNLEETKEATASFVDIARGLLVEVFAILQ